MNIISSILLVLLFTIGFKVIFKWFCILIAFLMDNSQEKAKDTEEFIKKYRLNKN